MVKDHQIYINHIKASIEKISNYKRNLDDHAFNDNQLIQDAVIRQFEIIGKATKRINKEVREKYPKIPCQYMAGMRYILIHNYLNVDIGIVWKTVEVDIPRLKKLKEEL